ncbi:MAG: hypothetical protein SNJ73_05805 [Acetobacteraceae bacterium]
MNAFSRRCWLVGAMALAGCTQTPGTPPEQGIGFPDFLGPDFGVTVGTNPVVTAVQGASYYLRVRDSLAGRPALAAQVAAQFEYAAAELQDLRFVGLSPLVQIQMGWGREELREMLGVRADAAARPVVEAFTRAAGALRRGDRAAAETALAGPVFSRPAAQILATLEAMPPTPRAGRAAAFAEAELNRPFGENRRRVF